MSRDLKLVLSTIEQHMGPGSAKGRAGIRSRQVAAVALRRAGATHAVVASMLGRSGHQSSIVLAQRGEQLEASEPELAALIIEASGVSTRAATVGRQRRTLMDLGPALPPPPPIDGRATIEQLAPDFASIARSLAGPRVNEADADDAVQLAAVAIWHRGQDLPADPRAARAVLRQFAARNLHRGKLARWIRERVSLPGMLVAMPPGIVERCDP